MASMAWYNVRIFSSMNFTSLACFLLVLNFVLGDSVPHRDNSQDIETTQPIASNKMQLEPAIEIQTGLYTVWNVLGYFHEICNTVLEHEGDVTHLWGRLDDYVGLNIIFYVDNVRLYEAETSRKGISLPIHWRARSSQNGLALTDARLNGDLRLPLREDSETATGSKIDITLGGAALARESWIEGRLHTEHDEEKQTTLLQEIKAEWQAMAEDPRQAKLENVWKNHGSIFEYNEDGTLDREALRRRMFGNREL